MVKCFKRVEEGGSMDNSAKAFILRLIIVSIITLPITWFLETRGIYLNYWQSIFYLVIPVIGFYELVGTIMKRSKRNSS